jgi:hypothetical protein
VSRQDLEAAIGRVLTSEGAAHDLGEHPERLASELMLDPAESATLVNMSDDLVGLMPGFVGKRKRFLQGVARRTLGLAGPIGHQWLNDYTESFPPIELRAGDGERWLGWLIEQIKDEAGHLRHWEVLHDVARLELMHHQAFRTPANSEAAPQDIVATDRPLRLHPSADLLQLGWDVANVSNPTPEDAAKVHHQPVDVLVFRDQTGRVTTEVVDEAVVFDALCELARRPLTLGALGDSVCESPAETEALVVSLRRLIRRGAIVQ